jgi:hypothetical protein
MDVNSYTFSLESFRSFRGSLFSKRVTGQEFFFAVSYSKPALMQYFSGKRCTYNFKRDTDIDLLLKFEEKKRSRYIVFKGEVS